MPLRDPSHTQCTHGRSLISYWQVIIAGVAGACSFGKLFAKYPRNYISLFAKQSKYFFPLALLSGLVFLFLSSGATAYG
jgi:hypothetical protein